MHGYSLKSFIRQTKPTTSLVQHVEYEPDLRTHAREKRGVKIDTNFWTHCIYPSSDCGNFACSQRTPRSQTCPGAMTISSEWEGEPRGPWPTRIFAVRTLIRFRVKSGASSPTLDHPHARKATLALGKASAEDRAKVCKEGCASPRDGLAQPG